MKKSFFRTTLIVAIVASMMLLGTVTSFAATEVSSPDDFGAAGDYVLSDDLEGDVVLSEGTYTIDLAGYSWSGNLKISGADVTITDSDANKYGLMTHSGDDVIVIESGKLTVTEITIEGNAGGCDGIFAKGGEVIINNCTISALSSGIQNKGGTMTVNGGSYTGPNGMKVNNNSFITVNGAEVRGDLNIGDGNTSYTTVEEAFVAGEGFKMEVVDGGVDFVADNGSSEDAGNEDAGNEDAGNENAGNENAGNEDAGNEDAGNEDAGNEDAGNEDAGNEDEDNKNPASGDVISLAVLAFSALSACTVIAKKKEN